MYFQRGNLLDQAKPGNIIVHGCNLQGLWGSGVAKQMKELFPEAYATYVQDTKHAVLGNVSYHEYDGNLIIASAYTQEFYGRDGWKYVSYDAIHKAFDHIFGVACVRNMRVHIPDLIGTGLGGGDYNTIKCIIESCERAWARDCICWSYNS